MDFKDALRALADGKNLRCSAMPIGSYVYTANNGILNELGVRVDIGRAVYVQSTWQIYEEPKAKRKITLWRRPWCQSGKEWFQPNWEENKDDAAERYVKLGLNAGWQYHGDWESVEVEVEE